MVLKHNKRPFGAEESRQPTCKHNIRRLNCGGRLASFAGISSFIDEGGKEVASQLQGESRVEGYSHVTCSVTKDEKPKTTGFAVVPKDHCSNGCYNTSGLLGGNNCDVVRPEYGRQILCEDRSFELGCAEFDQDFQLHLFSEILPVNSILERSFVSAFPVATCEEMPADNINFSGPPSLSWHTFNAHEEAIHLESPGGACCFPYFEDDHQMFECKLLEEINSSVTSYSYQKPITTGPELKADIPVWRRDEFQRYVGNSDDSEGTPADDNPSSTLSFSWRTCNTFEEDSRLESPTETSFIPYFEDDHQIAGHKYLEETCSSAFDYYERKPVAIGPHHQADIPVCGLSEFENSVGHLDDSVSSTSNSVDLLSSSAHLVSEEDSSDKWVGMCILPMPDRGTLSLEVKARSRQNLCNCLDMGSIRCVRQHVGESRQKLEQALGHEKFMMLGFGDMGEVVAQKWSTEEERAFQEVVMANPASLGKNFWDDLRHVFISRSSKELISYYFNVFMLRKRAEQNKMDPMNADSDNDEWQESNESVAGDGEDDSVVESPYDGDNVICNDGDATGVHEVTEDLYTCDGEDNGFCDVPENCNRNQLQPISDAYLSDKNFDKGMEEQDVQDDLCTSYDGEQSGADT